MISPSENIEEPYEELKKEIRKQMELILKYYDGINTRSLQIEKDLQQLKVLIKLKQKINYISNELTNDDKKQYETKQKMYIGKLNQKQILTPKETTLKYYKIKLVNDKYIIDE